MITKPESLVLLSNTESIQATSYGQLTLSNKLSQIAKMVTILPQLKSALLISIRQLYDNDYDVRLNLKKIYAFKQRKLVLESNRNISDGLWDIPGSKQSITPNNYVLQPVHPGLYKDKTHKGQNVSSIPPNASKNTIHSIQEELYHLSDLIDHNILDSTLHRQHEQDAKKYQKTSIHKDNHSLAVVIHKKNIHGACTVSPCIVFFLQYNLHLKRQ